MFGMSWAEIIIILAVGMFVLGPERIPVAVKWVGSTLKTVRTMAAGAQEQLRGEFGPELEELRRQIADLQSLKEIQELRKLRDLNPRTMITKNVLGEEFSGGLTGMLGLNQPLDMAKPTGTGVAEPPPAAVSDPAPVEAAPVEAAAAPQAPIEDPTGPVESPAVSTPVESSAVSTFAESQAHSPAAAPSLQKADVPSTANGQDTANGRHASVEPVKIHINDPASAAPLPKETIHQPEQPVMVNSSAFDPDAT